jgi:mycothiol synthase
MGPLCQDQRMTKPAPPTPPSGYMARPPVVDDLAATTTLLSEAESADGGTSETTPDLLREDWEGPGFDLARDAWLVFEEHAMRGTPLTPVGYARVDPRDQHRQLLAWVVVHPDHRGRGIGWYLTDLIEARAAEHVALAPPGDPVALHDGALAEDEAGHRLLGERGFTPVRHFWRMEAPLTEDLPPPRPPDGMGLRRFVLGQDDRAVHRAIQESFADHWGFVARGFDEWAAHRLHEHGFDPELWWVVEDGDEVVAALCGKIIDGVAWVDMLGVRSAWRKRGIGEALLRHSFLEFRRQGLDSVKLGVDAENQTGATALYERVGMHVARQMDVFEKRLR